MKFYMKYFLVLDQVIGIFGYCIYKQAMKLTEFENNNNNNK